MLSTMWSTINRSLIKNHNKLKPYLIVNTFTTNVKWVSQSAWSWNHSMRSGIRSLARTEILSKKQSKDNVDDFMALYPDIVKDLTHDIGGADLSELNSYNAEMINYVLPSGKQFRGLMTVAAYKILEKEENLSLENMRLANIMGWILEMLQISILMSDDIADNSDTRRGLPCWYKKEDVGLRAINDVLFLEQGAYFVLRKHFSKQPCYLSAMQLLHETSLRLYMGQILDDLSVKNGRPRLEDFTMKRYNTIVNCKTGDYLYLPVALAMSMTHFNNPEMHRQAKTILKPLGHFYQIQNDYLDCYGDPNITGKAGNDIREGKCSWLAVVALQEANPNQRKVMEQYYGHSSPEAINIIQQLYEELNLPNLYRIYEQHTYKMIRRLIQQVSKGLPHKLFLDILDQVFKRQ